jgi:xylulokinase
MDARGAHHIRRVTGGFPAFSGYGARKLWTWMRKTGGIPGHSGKDSIAHILYLRHEQPDRYAAALKFLEPKDYINYKLTGRIASTGETMTLHWVTDNRAIDQIQYDDELLRLAGLDRARLPDELLRSVDVLGVLDASRGHRPGAERASQGGGRRARHSHRRGRLRRGGRLCRALLHRHLVVAQLSRALQADRHCTQHGRAAVGAARALPADQRTRDRGRALNFLRDRVFFGDDALTSNPPPADVFTRLEAAAATAPPGSNRVIFTPWLNGERSPVDDHTVRAGWHNLSLRTTRGDLVRSVYEGVALNTRWLQLYVEKFIRRPLEDVRMVGGGARSDLWCQLHADVLQRPVLQIADPLHVNTRGAAFLAAVGLGYLRLEELAAHTPVAHRYEPRPATGRPLRRDLRRIRRHLPQDAPHLPPPQPQPRK